MIRLDNSLVIVYDLSMTNHTYNTDFDLQEELADRLELPAGWEVVATMGPSDQLEVTVVGPDRKVARLTFQHLDEAEFEDLAVWLGEAD